MIQPTTAASFRAVGVLIKRVWEVPEGLVALAIAFIAQAWAADDEAFAITLDLVRGAHQRAGQIPYPPVTRPSEDTKGLALELLDLVDHEIDDDFERLQVIAMAFANISGHEITEENLELLLGQIQGTRASTGMPEFTVKA